MKAFIKLSVLIVLLCPLVLNGQSWYKYYPPGGYQMHPTAITQTYDNGYLIASLYFVGGIAQTKLLKIDADGNVLWQKTIGNSPNTYSFGTFGIMQADDGGFVLTGTSRRFDPLSASFTMKFDACMERLWTKEYGVYNDADFFLQLKRLPDGNFVTGACFIGYDFTPAAQRVGLLKFTPNGDSLWLNDYSLILKNHVLDGIEVIDSNIYILGEAYIPPPGGTTGLLRSYIQKVDINGNLIFGKVIGDSVFTIPVNVIKASDTSLIFSTVYFTNNNYVGYNYLIKTDMMGNVIWGKFASDTTKAISDEAKDMVKINDSTAVILCASSPNDTASIYNYRIKLIKIDMDGNVLDSVSLGNTYDYSCCMIKNNEGNLIITGRTAIYPSQTYTPFVLKVRTSDFQIDTLLNLNATYDSLCALAITSGNIVYDTVTINGIAETTIYYNPIKVYPNPTQDKFALSNTMQSPMDIVVYNVMGEAVLQKENVNTDEWINTNALKNGIYFIKVFVKNRVAYTGKVLINK